MSTLFWLTNEKSDIESYLRLKMEQRSDCPSLVRIAAGTISGPTPGVSLGKWLTDPLGAEDLTASAWIFQIWGRQTNTAAHASLSFRVSRFTQDAGESTVVVVDSTGRDLATTYRSSGRQSVPATPTALLDGDRFVLEVLLDDSASNPMISGYDVLVSYNGLRSRAEGDSYIICPDNVALTARFPEYTRTAIRQMIQDVAQTNPNLKDQSVDQGLTQALRDYTRDKPYVEMEYMSGDGVSRSFAMPRRWVLGLSSMVEIEYPVDTEATKRRILEDDDWEIVEGVMGMQPTRSLRFIGNIPDNSTDNILLRYTTRHIHTDDEDTVPLHDLGAVICLGAAYCCLQLAAHAAASSNPTISADAVAGRDAAAMWQSIAKDLRARYVDQVLGGGKDTPVGAASVTRDWDIEPSIPGTDYIFHPARWR